jgi:hypothetical protein
MEAIKPLVVLVLFGTILYGAYSVVQKGPSGTQASGEAPPFAPPPVEIVATSPAAPVGAGQQTPTTSGPIPLAAGLPQPGSTMPTAPQPVAPPPAASATGSPAGPARATSPPDIGATSSIPAGPATSVGLIAPPQTPVSPPPAMPTEPPAAVLQPATIATAAGAGAALAVDAAAQTARATSTSPTYLTAESAPPPAQDSLASPAPPALGANSERPDRYATLATTPPASASLQPGGPPSPPTASGPGSSAAFATAWADAHEKLAAGRYAEALAALSIWYDDPSLGLEESQRLEDLLGQLAGTVIYSQQDLLLAPHVVAAGESLPAVAMQLGISWQLLGKINGIANPQDLVPGEHLKVLRGPFDAVVSVSRRRLSLQLGGNYAGSFPVVVGRQFLPRVGSSVAVTEIRRGAGRDVQPMAGMPNDPSAKPAILLADGLVIEAAEDPGMASEASPTTSLVVSVRDLTELLDILGPGSKVLIRQ